MESGITRGVWLAGLAVAALAAVLAGCESDTADPSPPAPAATAAAEPTQSGGTAVEVPGVFDDRVVFGQSAAFSGPARELGISMNLGIAAAFEEANRDGGVHARRLELTTRDAGYEP